MKIEQILERVYDRRRLSRAWQEVEKNAGAAGIDQMTVEAFAQRQEELLTVIEEKLKAGKYRFKPARRVLIPKPGSKEKRKLSIPVVMDWIVSQSMYTVLEEIFDPDFAPSNFGFRRGRSQKKAVEYARQAVLEGYEWCAAIDLKGFFDEIPHGLILKLIRRKISDERFVTLIARAIKAGVIEGGELKKTTKGVPQGSPVSPILSNIVLNELDQELQKRGHRSARWADDFIILLKSERAAHRVKEGISQFLSEQLGLPINEEKSQVGPVKEAAFLGFKILRGKLRISERAKKKFKEKVRELTRRNNGMSMYQAIEELNIYLKGWVGYFKIQEFRKVFKELDEFIRNRLRSMQLKKWKKPKKFQRMMIQAGYAPKEAHQTWVRMSTWKSVKRFEVKFTLNLAWFRRNHLVFLDDYTQRNLKFSFAR